MPSDLCSDPVPRPTPAMREAMNSAEVGDDVIGDDPTPVRKLEELATARLDKEAGIFVPSGTLSNPYAMLTQCGRGDEVIVGNRHIAIPLKGEIQPTLKVANRNYLPPPFSL